MNASEASICVWDKDKLFRLLEILYREYTVNLSEFVINVLYENKEGVPQYFEILVSIILSQNTSDKNAIKAFNNLKSLVDSITPEKIAKLDDEELKKAIKIAGLVNRRVIALKELARALANDSEFFERLNILGTEEARTKLLELPGVGLKTADVFLLMVLKRPTFPIDTHINRIVRRLGIASAKDRYENIRAKILNYIGNDIEKLTHLHLLLIIHGRKVCRARNPLCIQCTISSMCCRKI